MSSQATQLNLSGIQQSQPNKSSQYLQTSESQLQTKSPETSTNRVSGEGSGIIHNLTSNIHDIQKKPQRRLSRIALGKNLTLSQSAGLKLQWTVGA